MADYESRALAAWFRRGHSGNVPLTSVESAGGKDYVVLRLPSAITRVPLVVAVYRIRNDGMLKGLRRWPQALEGPR